VRVEGSVMVENRGKKCKCGVVGENAVAYGGVWWSVVVMSGGWW
jgi:hypothetical protein